jgi:hypothetical protein
MFSQLTLYHGPLKRNITISISFSGMIHSLGPSSLHWQVKRKTICINITNISLNHQDTSNKGESKYACIIIIFFISSTLTRDHTEVVVLQFQFCQWWMNYTIYSCSNRKHRNPNT